MSDPTARLRALLDAKLAAGMDGGPARIPSRPDPQAPVPLSPTQANLWFGWQYDPTAVSYHLPLVIRLRGRVDPAELAGALGDLAVRHDVLRRVVEVRDGDPVAVLRPVDEVPVAVRIPDGPLDDLLAEQARRPFVLDREPPMRAEVYPLDANEAVVALTIHHIATDGWSQDVLLRDLVRLYAARVGLAAPPEPARLQYADAVAWQAAQHSDDTLSWWEEQLRGMPAMLDLPTDRPVPTAPSWESGVEPLEVPAALAERVRALAASAGATSFMVLLAALQAVLGRIARTDDLVVGVPEAGRNHPDTEDLAGCFLNVLLIRGDLAGDPTGRELLARVRARVLGAFGHTGVSLEQIVDRVRLERQPGRPLYQVQFNVHNVAAPPTHVDGLAVETHYTIVHSAKFDLNVELAEDGKGGPLLGNIEYRRDLYDAETVRRLASWFVTVLDGLVADPDARVGGIPLEPTAGPVLSGPVVAREELPLHARIERWADERPEATAVVGPDGTHTYAQLDRRANQIAHLLLARGCELDEPIGVFLDPGVGFVAAVLGVLKAGGAYLPVDSAYPAARIADMLDTADVRIVLTSADLAGRIDRPDRVDRAVVALDDPAVLRGHPEDRPAVLVRPDNLLHVIFTSGSTGHPKGIAVEHRGVANCMAGMLDLLGEASSFAVVSTVAADLGLASFYGALLTGGTLHMVDRETATDPAAFAAYLRRHPVDVVKLVPSHLSLLARHGDLAAVLPRRMLVLGGEACPWSLVEQVRTVRPDLRITTHYGPTESSMFSLICDVDDVPAVDRSASVPLGTVLPNIGVHVLDAQGRPLPAGVPGELALTGPGVSRGYLNRPELTARRFGPDPAGGPGRCYRTGDLVRVGRSGTVEFLGRIDDQVKIRGHRVELDDVVSACRAAPGVAEAVVLPDGESHRRRLVSWVVPAPGVTLVEASVRATVRDRLPDYMVPVTFTVLERLPLNRNGKVDREALPRATGVPAGGGEHTPPRTDTERAIAAVWAQVLGVATVGARDDFFALGGHSFAATRVAARLRETLGRDFPLRLLFEYPELADLAAALDRIGPSTNRSEMTTPGAGGPIPRRADPDVAVPLSAGQSWWWLFSQLNPDSPVCHVPAVLRLSGELDRAALLDAVRDVADRHRVLRSAVRVDGEVPQSVVLPASSVPVEFHEIAESELDDAIRRETTRPFTLDTAPPMRAALFGLCPDPARPDEYVLVLTLHHLATDAWSMELLLADLAACYTARTGGPPAPPVPGIDHAGYVTWVNDPDRFGGAGAQSAESTVEWWCERLADAPAVLELPTDRPRPPTVAGPGDTVPVTLTAELTGRIRAAAASTGSTPFMVVLAAWQALLSRLSGSADVPVGVPVSGRTHAELDRVVGCFANTVVLRTRVDPTLTARQLVDRVRTVALDGFEHADAPFGILAQRLHPGAQSRDTPLFPVLMNFIDAAGELPTLPGLTIAGYDRPVSEVELDLSLVLVDRGADYQGSLTFRADLFTPATARRVVGWFTTLLDGLLSDLDRPISMVELLTPAERATVLTSGTGPALDRPPPTSVVVAVLDQADARPDAVAVDGPDGTLSYAQLIDWSGRVAVGLRAAGVGSGELVGVCLPRDHLTPAVLLAIWRAGGAYLPLDPDHPVERTRMLTADAGVRLVVSRGDAVSAATRVPGITVLDVDALARDHTDVGVLPAVAPDGLAYVIYTSGSTGRPKGVEVSHTNLAAQVLAYAQRPGIGPDDAMLAAAALTFDQAGEEIWTPLSVGGRCVMVDRECVLDGHQLAERIVQTGVTVADLSVALARLLLAAGWTPDPHLRVWTGTEALDTELARTLLRHTRQVWNTYGPTEATVMCTVHRVTEADLTAASIPIGGPVAGNRVYVVDAHGQLAPPGVPGELWVGGVGVARGYRGRPEESAAAFVPDPFVPGGRCYRTGDLVRWNAERVLEFLGRRDHQVKVRGHRIELGEVESVLHEHPDVRQAVVDVRGSRGEATLVGYLIPVTVDVESVRAHVQARLPDHMVPRRWAVLDELPLLHSGKVDRRSLPEPAVAVNRSSDPVSTDAEHLVAAAWAAVLDLPEVFASDDFFVLGGHSFAAVRVVSRLREALDLQVPVRALFDHPVLRDFALEVENLIFAVLADATSVTTRRNER